MIIKKQKDDKCPICFKKITKKNPWVKYHIRYKNPIVILSCKYCNFVEYLLRNGIMRKSPAVNQWRINQVIKFQKKFNINL